MTLTDEQKARLFDALERDGVDNWENYQGIHWQETMEEIESEEKFEENRKRLEPLFEIISLNMEVDYPAGREAGSSCNLTDDGVGLVVNFISKNYEAKNLTT